MHFLLCILASSSFTTNTELYLFQKTAHLYTAPSFYPSTAAAWLHRPARTPLRPRAEPTPNSPVQPALAPSQLFAQLHESLPPGEVTGKSNASGGILHPSPSALNKFCRDAFHRVQCNYDRGSSVGCETPPRKQERALAPADVSGEGAG